ncbi:MAG TPA: chemotaxis response regulator protein-glutamate methylesterase [Candidatus Binatia bacterium]|nr:chemotaxis response regulator protein-glutamate methylesterase [Candidatus Binatia bacterium]
MTSRIRILIVDDAVVVRRMVGDVLGSDPELEVVGTAPSGSIALQKIPQLNPDLVTLDVEMPGMTGIETLVELRKRYPLLPVIMFSTLTERGAATTLDALAAGASDYVTKPANVGSVSAAMQAVRDSLIPKIKTLCWRKSMPACRPAPVRTVPPGETRRSRRIDVLAIGTSTGGPNALTTVLPALPADFPVPIVIVQHMPPVFTRILAERLSARCAFEVREAAGGEELTAGHAWVAPGNHHMVVARDGNRVRLRLNQDTPENSCRPAVDPLFRSVAEVYGENALALVLTGMGHDGRRGAEAIRAAGGSVLVQDEATSVVWGMPGAVQEAGFADGVLALPAIAAEVVRRTKLHRAAPMPAARAS